MDHFRSPVVLFANGHGDHLMSLPTMRALATLFGVELTLVTRPGIKPLFYEDLNIAQVIELPMTRRDFDVDSLANLIEGCDLFLSFNPWHSESLDQLLERLGDIPTVGFFSEFSLPLPLDFSKHSIDLAFDVVRYLAGHLEVEMFAGPPWVAAEHERLARRLRAQLPAGARVAVVHGDTKSHKTWESRRFAEVLRWLLRRDPSLYVFDVGLKPAEGGMLSGEPRLIDCHELVLPAALAVTGLADFFVGVDSCFLHAADFCRVPGVGLFGATEPHRFGFRFASHRHVAAESMAEIGTDDVIAALESLLSDE